MADCEKISKCPFYYDRMANMPANAAQMKETYCHGDKTHCARYLVASAGKPVPMDLFPNQVDRARQILAPVSILGQSGRPYGGWPLKGA